MTAQHRPDSMAVTLGIGTPLVVDNSTHSYYLWGTPTSPQWPGNEIAVHSATLTYEIDR